MLQALVAFQQQRFGAGIFVLAQQRLADLRRVVLPGENATLAFVHHQHVGQRQQRDAQKARFRTDASGGTIYYVAVNDRDPLARPGVTDVAVRADTDVPLRFFRLIKNLTADGYYTSRAGLLEELGYSGNTYLARFPVCNVPEQ